MIKRRELSQKRLRRRMDELDRINKEEENKVVAEVAQIKRHYIKKFGKPKPVTNMRLKGIASERDVPTTEA